MTTFKPHGKHQAAAFSKNKCTIIPFSMLEAGNKIKLRLHTYIHTHTELTNIKSSVHILLDVYHSFYLLQIICFNRGTSDTERRSISRCLEINSQKKTNNTIKIVRFNSILNFLYFYSRIQPWKRYNVKKSYFS